MTSNKREWTRMLHWLTLSIVIYCIASVMGMVPSDSPGGLMPRAQAVLWKIGHLNIAAFLGYWFDRSAFRDRLHEYSPALLHMRRAIIIAAALIAMALAL